MDNEADASGSREGAVDIVKQWVNMWNGDTSIAAQIISPDNRVHAAMLDGGDGSAVVGASGMVDMVTQMRSLVPDLVSAFPTPARRWARPSPYGTDILRIADGLIVEYWLNADTLDLMNQLQVGAT